MRADRSVVLLAERVVIGADVVPAAVHVRNGAIEAITAPSQPLPDGAEVIRLADDEVLMPGCVDTHVHVNEPGRTEWEGFATATRAAAAGGVTTILDMPLNSVPVTTSVAALEVKRAAATGQCAVDVGFWGGAVPDSLGRLRELADAGVFGFKCFLLDSGIPEFPPLSSAQLRQAMSEIAEFDGILIVHAEDPGVIAQSARVAHGHYMDFLAGRPDAAETAAIDTVIAAARETGCRAHIVHLSSAAALPAVAAARASGVRLTVETCPHYLTLAAEDIADGHTEVKACPPVRGRDNAERLWQALADGVIDMIVSDHSPSTPELKFAGDGDFDAAWGGIASLELGLSLIWTEARRRGHSLARVASWMASTPARVVGMPGKGTVAVGNSADLVVFAPDELRLIDNPALHQRHPISPYHGRAVRGAVRQTFLRGQRIDLAQPARGVLISA